MDAKTLQDSIRAGILEVVKRAILYESGSGAQQTLTLRWEGRERADRMAPVGAPAPWEYRGYKARELKRGPPWLIGMSSQFVNHAEKIDRKLQGRILEAIAELSGMQIEPRGDTVKPLAGEYRGCWRYRIGDYRLIFLPDREGATITLMAFLPRAEAYD